MIDFVFTNEVVEKNFNLGPISIRPFKKIIKKIAYPDIFMETNIYIIDAVIEAYKTTVHDENGLLELLTYTTECTIHYIDDTYDLEHEIYEYAKNQFDIALKAVEENKTLGAEYIPRLHKLLKITQKRDYHCCQTTKDFWRSKQKLIRKSPSKKTLKTLVAE